MAAAARDDRRSSGSEEAALRRIIRGASSRCAVPLLVVPAEAGTRWLEGPVPAWRVRGTVWRSGSPLALRRRARGSHEDEVPQRSCAAGAAVGEAGMTGAIGKALERLVAAEAEVLGPWLVDRPAALPLLELKQRAAAPVVDRNLFGLRDRIRVAQHLALRDDGQPPPIALRLRARASLLARRICAASTSRGRDSPMRFILPITALRVTPISRAI